MAIVKKPAVRKLVVVENAVLASLAMNAQLAQALPFLKTLRTASKAKKAGCGSCGTASTARDADFEGVRKLLVSLPESKRKLVKQVLNAEKLQIKVKNGGKILKYVL